MNKSTYQRVTLRDGVPFRGVLQAQALAVEYSLTKAQVMSRSYGDFDALTRRYAALQAPPAMACPVQIGDVVHTGLTVDEAIDLLLPPAPAAVEAIEPPPHAVQLEDRRKAAQKPRGCCGLVRMHNVTASSNMAPTLPLCRVNDHASRTTVVTGSERFALVAKLQAAALTRAPRAVRSL